AGQLQCQQSGLPQGANVGPPASTHGGQRGVQPIRRGWWRARAVCSRELTLRERFNVEREIDQGGRFDLLGDQEIWLQNLQKLREVYRSVGAKGIVRLRMIRLWLIMLRSGG